MPSDDFPFCTFSIIASDRSVVKCFLRFFEDFLENSSFCRGKHSGLLVLSENTTCHLRPFIFNGKKRKNLGFRCVSYNSIYQQLNHFFYAFFVFSLTSIVTLQKYFRTFSQKLDKTDFVCYNRAVAYLSGEDLSFVRVREYCFRPKRRKIPFVWREGTWLFALTRRILPFELLHENIPFCALARENDS